jgi:flavin reductase (DIM6/NTAB) family NADH-FMN oxidoreductase RutF
MSLVTQCRKAVQRVVFGDSLLPQEFFLGFEDPQTEVAVWLAGMGALLDVTRRHSMACAAPFTVCVAFDGDRRFSKNGVGELSLKFCEREGQGRLLGEIGLRMIEVISVSGMDVVLFEARSSTNYCLPKVRLGAHYLLHSYIQRRSVDTSGMKMSFLERRAAMVMFIRPHPVSLVSLVGDGGGNIFPMNIMGDLGSGYIAFALKDSRRAAHLVERAGRIAVSSVPLNQAPLAYQLAVNHTKEFIEWDQLPFTMRMSNTCSIPVPAFAQRVREVEVERVHRIGSHTFFVGRVVGDQFLADGLGLCVIHGFYQAWRMRGRVAELRASLADDAFHKRGETRV